MTLARMLAVLTLTMAAAAVPAPVLAQGGCRQVLATVNVAAGSYGMVGAPPFDGRVYAYLPSGGRPTQVWIVEGVYGRPFVRPSGPLSAAEFGNLRQNRNIRATSVGIAKGDGSEGATVRVGKDQYRIVVVGVSGSGVQLQACQG